MQHYLFGWMLQGKKDIFYLLMIRGKKNTKCFFFLTCEKKINKFWTARGYFKLQSTAKNLFKSKGFEINNKRECQNAILKVAN